MFHMGFLNSNLCIVLNKLILYNHILSIHHHWYVHGCESTSRNQNLYTKMFLKTKRTLRYLSNLIMFLHTIIFSYMIFCISIIATSQIMPSTIKMSQMTVTFSPIIKCTTIYFSNITSKCTLLLSLNIIILAPNSIWPPTKNWICMCRTSISIIEIIIYDWSVWWLS